MGVLGAALAGSLGSTGQDKNRQLSSVWIEYEIHVPGEKAGTIRRTVFDLIGPAARATSSPRLELNESKRLERSLALTMKTEILPISNALSPQFVAALLARRASSIASTTNWRPMSLGLASRRQLIATP